MNNATIRNSVLGSPLYIYAVSNQFYIIGIEYALKNLFNDESKQNDGYLHIPKISPPAVNIALAFELAIKGILLHQNIEIPRSHDLHRLFKKLPNKLQDEIISRMNNEVGFTNFLPLQIEMPNCDTGRYVYKRSGLTKKNVYEMLEMQKDCFMEFRYLFEIVQPKEEPEESKHKVNEKRTNHSKAEKNLYIFDFPLLCNLSQHTLEILKDLMDGNIILPQPRTSA